MISYTRLTRRTYARGVASAEDDVRAVLLARRADLLDRMAGISAAPTDSGGISFGKRVGDGTSIAVERLTQVAAHEQMLVQYAVVERALEKLDDGTYGRCDVSRCSPGRSAASRAPRPDTADSRAPRRPDAEAPGPTEVPCGYGAPRVTAR